MSLEHAVDLSSSGIQALSLPMITANGLPSPFPVPKRVVGLLVTAEPDGRVRVQ